jgi:ribonucleotide monophosphatase NagD (HAD superfamily)
LKNLFLRQYKFEPEITQYGKPNKNTFKYCENTLKQRAEDENVEISNFYMVGDNPCGDIKGANDMGWTSILVGTGNFVPTPSQPNDLDNPAHFVVDGFSDAVDLILQKENIL